ncbi:hypothetical protein DOY81_000889 [Sarcophaga bullata]|nr:hypothetical protein DOY81_000889 [Sarcophaga bullata]
MQCNVETMTIKFTNLDCRSYDKQYAEFEKCYLKVMGRGKIGLQMYLHFHHTPINNITVNGAYFVKSSNQRYQPFLYNTTTDFCRFLKNPNSFPFWKILYNIIKPYTNLNSTCPLTTDIFVKNFILDGSMFKMIPFPSGDYLILLRAAVCNIYKAEARGYIQIKD